MPSIFLSHNPQFSLLSEIVDLCQNNGFGIELAAFSSIDVANNTGETEFYRKGISRLSNRSLHGPYLDLYPGSPDVNMRKITFSCFEQIYEIAQKLDIHHIIFHHNYDPSACTPTQWLKYSKEFWLNYLTAKSKDVQVHLENIMDKDPGLILELVREVDSPNLDIALDIGHMHVYSTMPLQKWIESLKDQIGYVHLHDNHGQEDEHLC
jgi:sugar phosphate isomerase/epimerase